MRNQMSTQDRQDTPGTPVTNDERGVAPPTYVVLLAMGGPDGAEAIEPFLRNLFSDALIIPVPGPAWFRRLVGKRIARRRLPIVRPYYERIGYSPLNAITERQASELERRLGKGFRVRAAFRYWGRQVGLVIEEAVSSGAQRIVAIPMYPQYCRATSFSSLLTLREAVTAQPAAAALDLVEIDRFFDNRAYLDTLAAAVRKMLQEFPAGSLPHVVFSAHGVPENLPQNGDPYVAEVQATAAEVTARLPPATPVHLTYQSRVGPVRWVRPFTDEVVRQLGADGVRAILMVPITFVADHLETLDEMDIRLREIALAAGIELFRRVPALNDDPAFMDALASLVRQRASA